MVSFSLIQAIVQVRRYLLVIRSVRCVVRGAGTIAGDLWSTESYHPGRDPAESLEAVGRRQSQPPLHMQVFLWPLWLWVREALGFV